MKDHEILLVYDRECPACNYYCNLIRIRRDLGNLRIIDARENSQILREITDAGLDIDQGMVLKMHSELYYGADAIHALALIGSRSGIFNRLNYWVFRSRVCSKLVYPMLKLCRNLLLKIMGKTKINNLKKTGNEKF